MLFKNIVEVQLFLSLRHRQIVLTSVARQILSLFSQAYFSDMLLVYEPVWPV